LVLNASACRLLAEAGTNSVALLWDKARSRMAVKVVPKGAKNSFSVSFTSDRHSGSLSGTFLRYVGWRASKRETLTATWNAKDKMLEVSLPPQRLEPREDRQTMINMDSSSGRRAVD